MSAGHWCQGCGEWVEHKVGHGYVAADGTDCIICEDYRQRDRKAGANER